MITGSRSTSQHTALGGADLPTESVVLVMDDGARIEGCLTVPRRGARLSDYLAQSDREFFTVADVTVRWPSGHSEHVAFVMIARRYVKMVMPGPPATNGDAAQN